jgi:hypothetical protein
VNLTADRHVVPRLRICVVILFSFTCLHGMVWYGMVYKEKFLS